MHILKKWYFFGGTDLYKQEHTKNELTFASFEEQEQMRNLKIRYHSYDIITQPLIKLGLNILLVLRCGNWKGTDALVHFRLEPSQS